MGANHVEPGNHQSPIARWLYCEAPVDAYTLHAYDWVSRQRPGDMPIDWDLDNIVVAAVSATGARLPVIVEELGTSRALPGVYTADDEPAGCSQELRQIEFVRQFPQVVGFGVWNGESPRLVDRTFVDIAPRTDLVRCAGAGRRLVLRPAAGPRAGRALPARKGTARLALRARRREQCLDRFPGHYAERRDPRAG